MPYTKDEAIAFIVDTRMTKDAYHKISFGTNNVKLIFILFMIVWRRKIIY